ncbi:hypothetical protein M413DRAFT_33151 [Hebeloma cylindrosporum]|uniref:Uncharacterized protein n=1 Tax=Hebeloma cylindrosporum TaxID=76867 RepID=A0A0C2X9E4_HEBCY|nr:hypothetical protein M413DRAFT_33151 [Hebeloma cylindrosporum h7]
MRYIQEVATGAVVEDISKVRSSSTLIDLELDVKGFPILPPTTDGKGLAYMKRVVRSFVTAHYRLASGRDGDKVPWRLIKENPREFVDAKYLPAGTNIEDPGDLKKDTICLMLNHWRRGAPASELFRFRQYLVKGEELAMAKYENMTGKKQRKKKAPVPVPVVDPAMDWDAEYERNKEPGPADVDAAQYRFSAGPNDVNMNQVEPPIDPFLLNDPHLGIPARNEPASLADDVDHENEPRLAPTSEAEPSSLAGDVDYENEPDEPEIDVQEDYVRRGTPAPVLGPKKKGGRKYAPLTLTSAVPPPKPRARRGKGPAKKAKGRQAAKKGKKALEKDPAASIEGSPEPQPPKPRPKPKPIGKPVPIQDPASPIGESPVPQPAKPRPKPKPIQKTGAQDPPHPEPENSGAGPEGDTSGRSRRPTKRKVDIYTQYEHRAATAAAERLAKKAKT